MQWEDGCDQNLIGHINLDALVGQTQRLQSHVGTNMFCKARPDIVCTLHLQGKCQLGLGCPFAHNNIATKKKADDQHPGYFSEAPFQPRPIQFKEGVKVPAHFLQAWRDRGLKIWVGRDSYGSVIGMFDGELGRDDVLNHSPPHPHRKRNLVQ